MTYHSNAIEGNTLSYADTYAILWNDSSMKVTATARELYEAINHKYALSLALDHLDELLTERLVKDIAILVNKNINEIDGYRRTGVFITTSEYVPPAASQINGLMMQLVHEYNQRESMDAFEREAWFHIKFEHVHPFADGNGRTGRILMNSGLMSAGQPPVVISVDDKRSYIQMIEEYDYDALANLLRELSNREAIRMADFEAIARDQEQRHRG